jgi:hypothetical protein
LKIVVNPSNPGSKRLMRAVAHLIIFSKKHFLTVMTNNTNIDFQKTAEANLFSSACSIVAD